MSEHGFKEIYDVSLKAVFPIKIAGNEYDVDEVILKFNTLQVATVDDVSTPISANGGYNNENLVTWNNSKEVRFNCNAGVLSQRSITILSNSKIAEVECDEPISVPVLEEEQYPENGIITLEHKPNGVGFIYNKETHKKLFSNITEQTYQINVPIIADYRYDYINGGNILKVGDRLINGYIKLEGKMRLKDDTDGHEKTALIEIPRLKITSSLSMRLGTEVNPMVGYFSFTGYPVGERGSQRVCIITFLNDDIDSDF